MAATVIDLFSRAAYTWSSSAILRAARERLGLTPAELAAMLNKRLNGVYQIRPGMITEWEERTEPPDEVAEACRALLSESGPAGAGPPASRPDTAPEGASDEVAAAALEAAADRSFLVCEPSALSIESLWGQSAEIARAANCTASETFSACHRIRGCAVRLAEQTHRPGALSDLYVITGQATALMASAAFDLNRWDAAGTLAQSAVSYAELAGHASLQAWTLGLAALLANWRNEPGVALDHFRRGLQVAPAGMPRARLRYIAARSHALRGDAAAVTRVLDRARHDQADAEAHSGDSLSEEIGGEFAFGRARADACAAAAWLDLGNGPEAKTAARRALADLEAMPAPHRSVSQVTGARIDLAAACLLNRERDEAQGALSHVFAVPVPLRNVSLSGRLTRAREVLASPDWRQDRTAQQLSDALGGWLTARQENQPQG